jgi:hypothetical protein
MFKPILFAKEKRLTIPERLKTLSLTVCEKNSGMKSSNVAIFADRK